MKMKIPMNSPAPAVATAAEMAELGWEVELGGWVGWWW